MTEPVIEDSDKVPEHAVGSSFEYKLKKILEKYKVRRGLLLYHGFGKDFNEVEMVVIGNPSIDWIADSMENLATEIEVRRQVNKIASGIPAFPDSPENN